MHIPTKFPNSRSHKIPAEPYEQVIEKTQPSLEEFYKLKIAHRTILLKAWRNMVFQECVFSGMCFLKKTQNIFFIHDGVYFTQSNILLHFSCYSNLKTCFSHPNCYVFNTCIYLMMQPMRICMLLLLGSILFLCKSVFKCLTK